MADMLSCVIDGGIIVAKVTAVPDQFIRQMLAYHAFVKLQFSPPVAGVARTGSVED